jgi:DtxR family Mn-dependent transcriptional regulator
MMTKIHEFGESYEMYLKAVLELAHPGSLAPVTAVAERLGVATVSASEMIHRLQDQGLVDHEPYKGVSLTEDGSLVANRVVRSHRLWERFLVDRLELEWVVSHDMACELEHLADPEVVDSLDGFLNRPATCPHGNPIPRAGRPLGMAPADSLDMLGAGDSARVLAIRPESASVLQAVHERGLLPGALVEVLEIELFDGPRRLRVDGKPKVIGCRLAGHIAIQREPDER